MGKPVLTRAYDLAEGDKFYLQNSEIVYVTLSNDKREILAIEENDFSGDYSDYEYAREFKPPTEVFRFPKSTNSNIIEKEFTGRGNNYILKDNLMTALAIAIDERQSYEKNQGYNTDSAFLQGLRMNLKSLKEGKSLYIK